jgi:hypothetical protein
MANTIDVNGVSADQVYQTIRNAGVADADAKLLVSNWIYQNYLTLARTFAYVTSFPSAVPACVPAPFARSFVHKDWTDGEDLVQAGPSANDDGFNVRLHHIEKDLDSLGSQVATVADCMADMRKSLSALLGEIAAELNRIDSDLGRLQGPVIRDPIFTGAFAQKFVPPNAIAKATLAYPGPLPPGTTGDPMLSYIGTTIYQEKAVSLFNTSQGVMIMPAVDVSTPSNVDTRVGAAGAFARAIAENTQLAQATSQAVTKAALVDRFGSLMLTNGQTVQQALAVLPVDAKYDNAQLLLADLAQRTAGALQSATGLAKQLATTVSAPANATSFSTVDISGMKELPPQAAASLRKAGIATIGQLASATPAALSAALKESGANVTAGEAAAIQGTAQTLSHMQIE